MKTSIIEILPKAILVLIVVGSLSLFISDGIAEEPALLVQPVKNRVPGVLVEKDPWDDVTVLSL